MKMKYMLSGLFIINTIISIGSIISSSIWIHYNDSYSTTSQFGFYLCIAFISSLMSFLYLILRYNCNRDDKILNNVACVISFFLTILWMAASICITLLTKDCLNDNNTYIGTFVNIIFGFISLCIWFAILWITMKRLLKRYKRLPALEAQASNEISRNN